MTLTTTQQYPNPQTGWEHAFGATELGQIRRRVGRFVRNPADLQDIVQESMLITLEKSRAGAIRRADGVTDYAVGVARNLLRGEARRQSKARAVRDALACEPEPEDNAIDSDTVSELIAKLPVQRDRDVLGLYLVRGLPPESIARCEGMENKHIYRVISRARQRLVKIQQACVSDDMSG